MRQWIKSLLRRWKAHRTEAAALNREIDARVAQFVKGDPDIQLSRYQRQVERQIEAEEIGSKR